MTSLEPSQDPLDPLLQRWRETPAPMVRPLTREVWRRIAHAEAPPVRLSLRDRLEQACGRPSFAFAFVAACILGGLFLAELRLSHLQAERSARLERGYLQLVDPQLQFVVRLENSGIRP